MNKAFGAPLLDLTSSPPTYFVAMERYVGNVFISFIPCQLLIIKNKKDIL